MELALIAYVLGAVVGFWRTDGRLGVRVALALLWPLGPAAFVVTVAGLLAASLVAFPLVALVVAGAAAAVWWVTG